MLSVIIFSGFTALSEPARADYTPDQYNDALKIASSEVQRRKTQSASDAISSTSVKKLFGRFYRVSDHWRVAAFQRVSRQAEMRELGPGESAQDDFGKIGIFEYRVESVSISPVLEAVLKVTQVGAPAVDPKVESLSLRISDTTRETAKSYILAGARNRLEASPQGLRTRMSLLELFPLDINEVATAKEVPVSGPPALPKRLKAIADRAGFKVDLARASAYEQVDLFGRPVDVLWQQGQPWPAFQETPSGVAILIGGFNE